MVDGGTTELVAGGVDWWWHPDLHEVTVMVLVVMVVITWVPEVVVTGQTVVVV
jgi:hypothetical protein